MATTLTSGFRKTSNCGTVTKVDQSDHGRTILEIDDKPVKEVYEKWSEGRVTAGVEWTDGMATVLASSSFCPLGEPGEDDYLRVMHPAFLNFASGALTTFAKSVSCNPTSCIVDPLYTATLNNFTHTIRTPMHPIVHPKAHYSIRTHIYLIHISYSTRSARVGMEVAMLTAAPETLAKKISESARGLLSAAGGGADGFFAVEDVVGALNIFCGGLVMAIDDMMPIAAEQLAGVVGHTNTMGICCFGEQGMDVRRKAIHGNLMFGCLLFSNQKREFQGTEPAVDKYPALDVHQDSV